MRNPRAFIRVLWCTITTMAVVLTGDIPWWVAAAVLTLIPVFGLAEPSARWLPGVRRVSAILAVAYLLFFPIDWIFLSGRLIFATVHLTFYLKLHTLLHQESSGERSRLHLICVFEMLAAASMTVDAIFIIPLTLFVVVGALVLTLEQSRPAPVDKVMLPRAMRTAMVLTIPLLAVAAIVFVTLPRSAFAGFRLGGITGITVTGFSERVRLGDFEEIRRDRGVVMRIVADDVSVSPPRWRGPAYDRYENAEWRQSLSGVSTLPRGRGAFLLDRPSDGPRTTSEVFLEPLDTDILFLPPASSELVAAVRFVYVDPYLTLRTGRSARAGRRYAVSWNHAAEPSTSPVGGVERLSRGRRRLYTQLPELSERFHGLAAEVTVGQDGLEAARLVERHLQTSYGYTLSPPPRVHPDPVEDFLFEARAGHCEYFATAMVMMMRSRDIPSRLVTGFTRGEINDVGEFEVVRKTNAHAWVEVFDEQRGWVAFDPTPASSGVAAFQDVSMLSQGIDSLRMLWDMYVVAFDVERQRGVLGNVMRVGVAAARAVALVARYKTAIGGVFLLLLVIWLLRHTSLARRFRLRVPFWPWRTKLAGGEPPVRFYAKLLGLLAQLGIEKPLGETAFEFARQLEGSLPGITEVTLIYYRVRFGDDVLSREDQAHAERLCAAIRLAALGDARRLA
ncbi:MAG: DUF3488 domain-containing protein [Acidobacteria bacterium]|nr:MAG: DUF3488 domain-containing protein [Acidobacteriota bacterium]